uniref:WW domain-containing protein n=1 Tax=Phaeomonas parva TaxID=124430 RepID=A0A7S1XQ26_9STRA|mmetsp:Transcript_23399/g.73391  ORF Transcript_23399/g.73391 Transcript_23399/m.73391 type:complete len:807 (+) Transcript_23399:436-2856(+)
MPANLNASNSDGNTPLHLVVSKAFKQGTELLLSSGAKVDVTNAEGKTCLHLACALAVPSGDQDNKIGIISSLLEAGGSPNLQDASGNTPLHYAVETNCLHGVESLLAKDASPKIENAAGDSPLHIAAVSGYLEVMQLLILFPSPGEEASPTRQGQASEPFPSDQGVPGDEVTPAVVAVPAAPEEAKIAPPAPPPEEHEFVEIEGTPVEDVVPEEPSDADETWEDEQAPADESETSDWEACFTEEGHRYYYNRVDGSSKWERPEGFNDAATEESYDAAAPEEAEYQEEYAEEEKVPGAEYGQADDEAQGAWPPAPPTEEEEQEHHAGYAEEGAPETHVGEDDAQYAAPDEVQYTPAEEAQERLWEGESGAATTVLAADAEYYYEEDAKENGNALETEASPASEELQDPDAMSALIDEAAADGAVEKRQLDASPEDADVANKIQNQANNISSSKHMAIWERFFENALLSKTQRAKQKGMARTVPLNEGWMWSDAPDASNEKFWPLPTSEDYRAELAKREKGTGLLYAAAVGEDRDVMDLLLAGSFPDMRDTHDRHPLHHAAALDREQIARVLVDHGASVDTYDGEGMTPLHVAAWRGSEGAMKALLESAADVSLVTDAGDTALHYAVKYGRIPIVRMLLRYGASADTPNHHGLLPIDLLPRRRSTREVAEACAQITAALENPTGDLVTDTDSVESANKQTEGERSSESSLWGSLFNVTSTLLSPLTSESTTPVGASANAQAFAHIGAGADAVPEPPASPAPPTDDELVFSGIGFERVALEDAGARSSPSRVRNRYVDVLNSWQSDDPV